MLDMVAGDYLPKNLQLLKQDGRCVVIALQGGATADGQRRHRDGEAPDAHRLDAAAAEHRQQGPHGAGAEGEGLAAARSRQIRPIIYKTFPLKDAAGAHAELERADHVGKVMMTV